MIHRRKNYAIYIMVCVWTLFVACCSGAGDDTPDDITARDGYISFCPSISDNGEPNGEDAYNENKFTTLDIFLYDEDAGDDEAALLHHHESLTGTGKAPTVKVPTENLARLFANGGRKLKVVAIANCSEVAALSGNETSINRLKAVETRAEAGAGASFQAATAPESFVMNTFGRPLTVAVNGEGQGERTYTLAFDRLAAKIRVALSVKESVTDKDGVEWIPDTDDMRLYISNGVRTSRLDGDVSRLTHSANIAPGDRYYSISTSGSKDTEDYGFARRLTRHDENWLSGKKDKTYLYYNDIPYYTYPNKWSSETEEPHQTMLVVVVPWKCEGNKGGEAYMPTYYVMSVDEEGTIASDTFYYLRARIEEMGSREYNAPIWTDAIHMKVSQWIVYENDVVLW